MFIHKSTGSIKPLLLTILIWQLLACSSGSGTDKPNDPEDPVEDKFSISLFDKNSAIVNNSYFPLVPGTMNVYEGVNEDGLLERTETFVSHDTREVNGVLSVIVVDREYEDGELIEETFDWFAQDINGQVWYMGEASAEIEDGEVVSTEGSWESGSDVDDIGSTAEAGIVMKTNFVVNDSYQQEYYQGIAEDMAQITATDVTVMLNNGDSYTALQTTEWTPLEPDDLHEYKYYVKDIGLIKEENIDGSEAMELIKRHDQRKPDISVDDFINSTVINNPYLPLTPGAHFEYEVETDEGVETTIIDVLNTTKEVMGITVVMVHDQEFLDEVLIEDTQDWFAQDNDGNVWYFGEAVINYHYDENGGLIDTDNEGAWEAGVDGAQPGLVMPAEPRIGDSYRQEYYAGEAEDLAVIDAFDVEVVLADGSTFTTLKIKEWNPLEADSGYEYKYYAPNLGLVREEDEDGEEQNDLTSFTLP